jgi:hypothetical protein
MQKTGGAQAGAPAATYDVNLAQTITVTQPNPLELTFSSSAFPTFSTYVLSTGTAAVDLSPVGVVPGGADVEEIAFAKDMTGNWVLILQLAMGDSTSATVVQFASYDPKDAPPASATLAVDYLDQMFALAGTTAEK